jgi:hypothetical protein
LTKGCADISSTRSASSAFRNKSKAAIGPVTPTQKVQGL